MVVRRATLALFRSRAAAGAGVGAAALSTPAATLGPLPLPQ